jgi:hypothetical protein
MDAWDTSLEFGLISELIAKVDSFAVFPVLRKLPSTFPIDDCGDVATRWVEHDVAWC